MKNVNMNEDTTLFDMEKQKILIMVEYMYIK